MFSIFCVLPNEKAEPLKAANIPLDRRATIEIGKQVFCRQVFQKMTNSIILLSH